MSATCTCPVTRRERESRAAAGPSADTRQTHADGGQARARSSATVLSDTLVISYGYENQTFFRSE